MRPDLEQACAKFLIELAFVLPKGTDLRVHPIATALKDYVFAIQAHERADARVPHIYDPKPVTDESTLTIADLRHIVLLAWHHGPDADRVAERLDACIAQERARLHRP